MTTRPSQAEIRELADVFCSMMIEAGRRAKSEEEFFNSKSANRAYNALHLALARFLGPEVEFNYTFWGALTEAAHRLYSPTFDRAQEEEFFRDFVHDFLRVILETAPINKIFSIFPAGYQFSGFPGCTDFGHFSIISPPRKSGADRLDELALLIWKTQERHPDDPELVGFRDQLANLGEFTQGRYQRGPLLWIPIGIGLQNESWESSSEHIIPQICNVLRLASLEYELTVESKLSTMITRSSVPDLTFRGGPLLLYGTTVERWERRPSNLTVIEGNRAGEFDHAKFVRLWETGYGEILDFLLVKNANSLRDRILPVVEAVSMAWFRPLRNLPFVCGMGLEAILNPFGSRSELTERTALFGSSVLAETQEERIETYDIIRRLYKLRSNAVHSGTIWARSTREDEATGVSGFRVFVSCLKYLVSWAISIQDEGREITQEEFKELYLRTISKGLPRRGSIV